MIGTHHCGNKIQEAFKRHSYFQDVFCHSYYVERVAYIFVHQTQSEYYGVNRSVFIEGINLEYFNATDKETYSSSSHKLTCHAVFH